MKFKKKTQMLYQEAILIVFSFLIISLTLYFALNYISGTKYTIEKSSPELSYKFPATFVHGFLYAKVSEEDIKNLSLDETQNYYVKDLIYINSKDSIIIVKKMRDEYILDSIESSRDNGGNMHTYYKAFSKENYDENSKATTLLPIQFNVENVPILEDSFNEKNYFYYIKQQNGKYTIVYFISKGYNQNENYISNTNYVDSSLDKEIANE